ncbi:MAG: hypothetical protein AUG49_11110 [Catenulispora sp. 13_1_20CM_3_70_7]|jgi:antitoxin YefM|nr:MAG: hypothetical protein AUG49_11110 [Catenulispora sp. 13_1_20CM_3_70_7]
MNTVPYTEARDKFREILDEVATTGTEYVVTRHGRPVAVVLGYDDYESLIETLNILSDESAMTAIAEGEAEFSGQAS